MKCRCIKLIGQQSIRSYARTRNTPINMGSSLDLMVYHFPINYSRSHPHPSAHLHQHTHTHLIADISATFAFASTASASAAITTTSISATSIRVSVQQRLVHHPKATQPGVVASLPRHQHRVRLNVLDGHLQDQRHVAELLRLQLDENVAAQLGRLVAAQMLDRLGASGDGGERIRTRPFRMVAQPLPQLLAVAGAVQGIVFFGGGDGDEMYNIRLL